MDKKILLTKDALAEIEDIRSEANHLSQAECPELTLDLEQIPMLDSMLLGQLVRLQLLLRQRGIALKLINISSHARQVIHHANLDSVFGLPLYEQPRWDSSITNF